ncbi:putative glucan endo-1,3-beta-glucosidase [Podosphaera aphanis]|nr:putative glucan endo-1,3-beta-glucosidase [Podosphaera aphanis]
MSRRYSSDDQELGFQENLPSTQSVPSAYLHSTQLRLEQFPSSRVSPSFPRQQVLHSPPQSSPLSMYSQNVLQHQNPTSLYSNERLLPDPPQEQLHPPPPPPHQNDLVRASRQGPNFRNPPLPYATHLTKDWGYQDPGIAPDTEFTDLDVVPEPVNLNVPRLDLGSASEMNHPTNDRYSCIPPSSTPGGITGLPGPSEPIPLASTSMINNTDTTSNSRLTMTASPHSFNRESLIDLPYRYPRNIDPNLGDFDPNSIEDDSDDGLEYRQRFMSVGSSHGNSDRKSLPTTSAGGPVKGNLLGSLGSVVGKKPGDQTPSRTDDSINGSYNGRRTANGNYYRDDPSDGEKSEWLSKQSSSRSKLRILILVIVTIVLVGAIAGGITGGILSKKKSTVDASDDTAPKDSLENVDLDKDSPEIKKLMKNPKLHKVFPALDYTPIHSRYPNCLKSPLSQNNITRDLAVLSQLSNTIRLYGTDCNQTEMLIYSIDRLGLKGQVKIWMGVWLDKNETTNARQIAQMYNIFDQYGAEPFAGVVVGNEVLFREDMTSAQLGSVLSSVRANLTSLGISLPISSSDLGDDWTAQLASKTDLLMANIHPFFAGVSADVAAGWTWNFWQQHNVILQPDLAKNVISETGWPSAGGTSCGGAVSCTTGSVASTDAMNTFMRSWVCQALANGTNYFWFEAFDEPWKVEFNEPGKEWEDKWGLMDVNRNLKPGLIIPDCDGKTVS